jgi:hypothetical protein
MKTQTKTKEEIKEMLLTAILISGTVFFVIGYLVGLFITLNSPECEQKTLETPFNNYTRGNVSTSCIGVLLIFENVSENISDLGKRIEIQKAILDIYKEHNETTIYPLTVELSKSCPIPAKAVYNSLNELPTESVCFDLEEKQCLWKIEWWSK